MRVKQLCRILAFAAPAAFVLYLSALYACGPLFELYTPLTPANVIVVLGGDGPGRAAKAANVYHAIASANPRILISGDVDCGDIARLMVGEGVPADRITLECTSRNTWQNAEFSKPLLAAMDAKSAILVTSWFHVRRALGCFHASSPQIRWEVAPVEPRGPLWRIAWEMEGIEAVKEYPKIVWYMVRYGVFRAYLAPASEAR
jgi:uncharacterized SAM-binding protein YcdF (DUF218 family)